MNMALDRYRLHEVGGLRTRGALVAAPGGKAPV